MTNKYFKAQIITLVFISFFLAPSSFLKADTVVSSTITISAQVNTSSPNGGASSGGGGGGSVGDKPISIPTTVNFSGMAYPSSKVFILKDGRIAVATTADPEARFSVSINNLETNTYNFTVYGQDIHGLNSSSYSFPVYVTSGTTVNIGGIFISPTTDIDKTEVRRGDNLLVFGQTIPNSNVSVIFHSEQEIIKNTKTDKYGLYKYTMDTSVLEYGDHTVKSKSSRLEDVSPLSKEIPFIVGLTSKSKEEFSFAIKGDLNKDRRVNLIDFSILAFWYKKISPPPDVDLNGDGKVTLVDFSILAFNWTG